MATEAVLHTIETLGEVHTHASSLADVDSVVVDVDAGGVAVSRTLAVSGSVGHAMPARALNESLELVGQEGLVLQLVRCREDAPHHQAIHNGHPRVAVAPEFVNHMGARLDLKARHSGY